MKVKFKLLSKDAIPPKRMTNGAAGFDLYATGMADMLARGMFRYHTDVAFEIPAGHVGLVFPRSSICRTTLRLSNCVGVIDSDYRGEVTFVFDWQKGDDAVFYRVGDRIGQIVFVQLPEVELEEVEELSPTDRGRGGYGSTGK